MSTVSTIYDAIVSKMAGLYPNYHRIANPYDIGANPEIMLKKSWGIAIGPGVNTERFVGCLSSWERTITIAFMRQVVKTENDATGKASVEKLLLEDANTLLLDLEADPTISGSVIKTVFADDSGIQYVQGRESSYLAIEIGLRVEYLQDN